MAIKFPFPPFVPPSKSYEIAPGIYAGIPAEDLLKRTAQKTLAEQTPPEISAKSNAYTILKINLAKARIDEIIPIALIGLTLMYYPYGADFSLKINSTEFESISSSFLPYGTLFDMEIKRIYFSNPAQSGIVYFWIEWRE